MNKERLNYIAKEYKNFLEVDMRDGEFCQLIDISIWALDARDALRYCGNEEGYFNTMPNSAWSVGQLFERAKEALEKLPECLK